MSQKRLGLTYPKPSNKIRQERLEILNRSQILKLSHDPSGLRVRRCQITYETPHLQGPAPSESPAGPEENTSERFSNCLTPHSSYPRARHQITYETPHLQGPAPSESPAGPEENTSERFSNRLTPHSSYPVRVTKSPTKLPTCKVLHPVSHLQNLRKIRASDSQTVSYSQTVSRRTAHTPVRVAKSPTKLPTCKVLHPVSHQQDLRKIRASDSQTVSYSHTASRQRGRHRLQRRKVGSH